MELDVHLKKSIGDFRLDCTFTLSAKRAGVFGPSGSGKSTLMHLLAGLATADSGHIRLDDQVLYDSSNKFTTQPEKRRIGVVFQHAHLFPHLSVEKNLLYGYARTAREERKIEPEGLFRVLGVDILKGRDVTTLSGGERQRVALARTILSCPRLILMDEPLSGLDEERKFTIIPYLERVFGEYAIPLIFISHSLLEMRMMTDEVLVMAEGSITRQLETESFARTTWDTGRKGYVNLISLGPSRPHHDLFAYDWGENSLILTEPGETAENLFELDAREIILFKRHPEATSARNLLHCKVMQVYMSGNRARVELETGEKQLIAQIVPESVRELGIEKGSEVIAAIKASAFVRIF
jgi:molybdate transport system ATP-binding protein